MFSVRMGLEFQSSLELETRFIARILEAAPVFQGHQWQTSRGSNSLPGSLADFQKSNSLPGLFADFQSSTSLPESLADFYRQHQSSRVIGRLLEAAPVFQGHWQTSWGSTSLPESLADFYRQHQSSRVIGRLLGAAPVFQGHWQTSWGSTSLSSAYDPEWRSR